MPGFTVLSGTLFQGAGRVSEAFDNRSAAGLVLRCNVSIGAGSGTCSAVVELYDPAADSWGEYADFGPLASAYGEEVLLLDGRGDATPADAVDYWLARSLPQGLWRFRYKKSDGSTWAMYPVAGLYLE
jgi:hypothetical protein